MSYGSRLEGTLALDPQPEPALFTELRAELDALGSQGDSSTQAPSAWKLTPLGGRLVNEAELDWEAQLAWLDRALREVFAPRGLSLLGRLEAIGEDESVLAEVRVDTSGIVVEGREEDADDPDAWLSLLAQGNDDERRLAAEQLTAFDAELAVPALIRALTDQSADVRRVALESLGGFGEAALPSLDAAIVCLSDDDRFVRYWATFALGRMGKRAAPALRRMEELTRDTADGPRYGALDAIRRIRS